MKCLKQTIRKKQIQALRNKEGIINHSWDNILRIIEIFYTEVYKTTRSSEKNENHRVGLRVLNVVSKEIPDIEKKEVIKVLNSTNSDKATSQDNISVDIHNQKVTKTCWKNYNSAQ